MKTTSAIILFMSLVGLLLAAPAPEPVQPIPSNSQLAWQRLEMTTFFHFGVNTFTDREWGDGKEDPAIFNPSALDTRQWVRTAKNYGSGLMILTAKHHDGFCLWPSKYTDHCVKRSTWKDGKGDVVREFTDACRAENVKVGLYLSPWDRHEQCYGTDEYNTYFKNQLTELLTNYGKIDEVWFDGACGEGPNGKKQVYDFESYYTVIRKLQPDAVIAIMGPDVRWVGNESGVARPGESSVQKRGDKTVWHPAECDVSIRPGWFYHATQDNKVKTLEHLLDIYFKSVGRNSVLLINLPPDRRGLIADPDVARLKEFRSALDEIFKTNLATGKAVSADNVRGKAKEFSAAMVVDGKLDTCWATDDGATTGRLEIDLGEPREFNLVNIQEPIELGERVRKYRIEVERDGKWQKLVKGSVIGHRNLLGLPKITARKVALVIEDAHGAPAVSEFGIYLSSIEIETSGGSLTASKPCEASNVHAMGTSYGGDKAIDDDVQTRWATSDETRACWLEVDLLKEETFARMFISELDPRIAKFELQIKSKKEDAWKVAYKGRKAGKNFNTKFNPVTARYVRLDILEATGAPTIWEFQLFPPKQ
ncbi:MAG: hypothetical protein A2283_21150 [Lentisphaerae bacterium RIFOXYA12_FULL_48_11]|nr:MAG: hypothetical protein A2283_21150 [Lentisphaerae bacterium RIFOXYA12_FULL_48_11]